MYQKPSRKSFSEMMLHQCGGRQLDLLAHPSKAALVEAQASTQVTVYATSSSELAGKILRPEDLADLLDLSTLRKLQERINTRLSRRFDIISYLPTELILEIVKYLDILALEKYSTCPHKVTFYNLLFVSKSWYRIFSSEQVCSVINSNYFSHLGSLLNGEKINVKSDIEFSGLDNCTLWSRAYNDFRLFYRLYLDFRFAVRSRACMGKSGVVKQSLGKSVLNKLGYQNPLVLDRFTKTIWNLVGCREYMTDYSMSESLVCGISGRTIFLWNLSESNDGYVDVSRRIKMPTKVQCISQSGPFIAWLCSHRADNADVGQEEIGLLDMRSDRKFFVTLYPSNGRGSWAMSGHTIKCLVTRTGNVVVYSRASSAGVLPYIAVLDASSSDDGALEIIYETRDLPFPLVDGISQRADYNDNNSVDYYAFRTSGRDCIWGGVASYDERPILWFNYSNEVLIRFDIKSRRLILEKAVRATQCYPPPDRSLTTAAVCSPEFLDLCLIYLDRPILVEISVAASVQAWNEVHRVKKEMMELREFRG